MKTHASVVLLALTACPPPTTSTTDAPETSTSTSAAGTSTSSTASPDPTASTTSTSTTEPAPDLPPDAPANCGMEGELFGPCPPDTHICADGLICLDASPVGTSCGVDGSGEHEDLATCAAMLGVQEPRCDFVGRDCFIPCAGDEDCKAGTVCSKEWGACVWPA